MYTPDSHTGHRLGWKLPVFSLAGALLVALFAAAMLLTPGVSRPTMAEGDIQVYPSGSSALELVWPEADGASNYLLYEWSSADNKFVQREQLSVNRARLEQVDLTRPLRLKIEAVTVGSNMLGMSRGLTSENCLDVTIAPRDLPQLSLSCLPNTDKSVYLSWQADGGVDYEVYVLDENGLYHPVANTRDSRVRLQFGASGDLDMPSYEQPVQLVVRAAYQGEGYVLYGPYSQPSAVEREALLGDKLTLTYSETENDRIYELRWGETKGDYYEIQEWSDTYQHWEPLQRIERNAELVYYTERLASGSVHRYRLAAYDEEAATSFGVTENNGFSADPVEIQFQASVSPLYCTIWPIVDLDLFSNTRLSGSLAKIPAGTALCVLEEKGSCFYVRYKEQYGYVDSRFCMINLSEYLGAWCAYDITNSYRSLFKVHEYPIEGISYGVVQGYENIRVAEDEYLVPYLYPCAGKLFQAAQAVQADGYRLRIYEAFRPNEATRFLYDTTEKQLNETVPAKDGEGRIIDTRTGLSVDAETGLLIDPDTGALLDPRTVPDLPPEEPAEGEGEPAAGEGQDGAAEPAGDTPEGGSAEGGAAGPAEAGDAEPAPPPAEDGTEANTEGAEGAEGTEGAGGAAETEGIEDEQPLTPVDEPPVDEPPADEPEPEPPAEERPTYSQAMTDGRFRIGSFLAAVTSAHNRGIALDLTLETLDTGEELVMQSPMHDLSWHSATYLNNDNAKLLAKYMTGVGMRGLSSEWWHFQDDATREKIGLSSYLYAGVSAEGWKRDDHGWRYRAADGSYYHSKSITVDGVKYALDGNGYVIE